MIPTPEHLDGSLYRIYFSGRDETNRSHIGWVTIDLERPDVVLDVSPEPVLYPGELGCFDDNGVTPSCVIRKGRETLLYYIGWNPGSTVRMHLFGGLAISQDGGETFTRYSRAPIIERTNTDPFLNTAPFVVEVTDGYLMYYVSGVEWVHRDLPRYNIKVARSDDGLTWRRDGRVAIDFAHSKENALARPFVVKENGKYCMWFAHKGSAYRLGYAESPDGVTWARKDSEAGIDVSSAGWDSEMIEYACVIPYGGAHVMYYNGNDYGRAGFGLAIAE